MRKEISLLAALKSCSLALLICVLAVVSAPAQSISGRVVGNISDPTGAFIRNAEVKVTSDGTGVQRRTTADENGFYVVPELPVGYYSLKVEVSGFAPAVRTRIKVDVGAETRVDVMLLLQATTTVVDVRSEHRCSSQTAAHLLRSLTICRWSRCPSTVATTAA
jgi:Carboxypeptidase regulatory-like domain